MERAAKQDPNFIYGLEVIKVEYWNKQIHMERKEWNQITKEEEKIQKLLQKFKDNQVTPMAVEDIMEDIDIEEVG